jgi:hypothetical protein
MTFIVGAIGIIIMLTPITRPRAKGEKMNSFYYLVKRWVFGAVLVVCGLGSWIPYIRDYASGILYGTSVAAGLIIIFMGIIYFFSAFKRMRKVQFVSS